MLPILQHMKSTKFSNTLKLVQIARLFDNPCLASILIILFDRKLNSIFTW